MNKLLFIIVVLYVSVDNAQLTQEHLHNSPHDWDVLLFSQSWPETFCNDWVHQNPSHTCEMPQRSNSWSVHGIWPSKLGTKGPLFCNRTWHFDPEAIRPIESQVAKFWSKLKGGTDVYTFWTHEWTKHGTCAAVLEPLNSELKYFSKGNYWGEKYEMARILAKNGVIPDDNNLYSLPDIHYAVKITLGVNPIIQCRKEEGKNFLDEIRICFNKNLELQDCDGVMSHQEIDNFPILTNCDTSQDVFYPHHRWPENTNDVKSYNANNAQQNKKLHNQNDWDLLIYTQQWPETVCREWVHKNPSHTCNLPKKTDSWSVHGVWPTKFGTKGPAFCNRTWHFDPEQIRPIESDLIDSWTNIEGGTEKYSFWAHEWTKHGTCAAVLEPLNSELKYFTQGLKWGEKYGMSRILALNGIVPDDDKLYSLPDIHFAVKNTLGINPNIQCRKEDGKSYIDEIRICFNKNLELHDCDGTVSPKEIGNYVAILTNCDTSQGILYPHNKWPINKIYVELYKLVSWLQWFTL